MSLLMDEVDHEFIKALFPQYLLSQPISHELWKIYYQHKKLFHKLKAKGEAVPIAGNRSESSSYRLGNNLSYSTRKEIWEKLMSLGVLGTISYDSTSDDYLVQVYKYFFNNSDDEDALYNERLFADDRMQVDYEVDDLAKPDIAEESITAQIEQRNDEGDDNVEAYDDNRDEDDENDDDVLPDDDDDENNDDGNDDDNDDDDDDDDEEELLSENEHTLHPSSIQSRSPNELEENTTYYPPLSESMRQLKSKHNPVSTDLYRNLGYSLPYKWISQSNNSILVSADGFAQLKPNPNWQVYSGYDRASPVIGNRLRASLNNNQKLDYATTWTNNPILHRKLALFYYEVKILSVTSSQSGQNCNIIVGFKDFSKIQGNSKTGNSGSPSRADIHGDPTSLNRQSASILNTALGSSNPNNNNGRGNGFDKGSFGYCGTDGYITDGTQFKSFAKQFGRDDIVGCGINYADGTIFFTKNGVKLGTAFTDVYDMDLVPYIALRPGNSVRTNFGLHEEFIFDITGYQNRWKVMAYQHIFKSIDDSNENEEFELEEEEDGEGEDDSDNYEDSAIIDDEGNDETASESSPKDGFLLSRDRRFSGDKLYKPELEKLNSLNTNDDSITCTLDTMINDYLIHEGLIDVAKGFLKDLQKNCVPDNDEERGRMVIRHNERQIIKEEENLKVRQDIRRFINNGNFAQCLKYIDCKFPGLLQDNVDLLFELKVAEYLLTIVHYDKHTIDTILQKGQELSSEFVYNTGIPVELRERFKSHLGEISALLAYDNPLKECSEDLAVFLSPAYLQERLFQLVNSRVLRFLKKNSESSLENMVSYTRAMVNTLMEYGDHSSVIHNDSELRYYKLVNIDEDLLNL